MPEMKSSLSKPQIIQTVLAIFLFMFNGYFLFENFPKISILLLVTAILLLMYIIRVSLRISQNWIVKPLVLLLEGTGFLATSYIFYRMGKIYLPYGYLLAALVCFFGAYYICKKTEKGKVSQQNEDT